MQIMDPIRDVLKDLFHRSVSLVDGDLHHRSLAGAVFYGRLGDRVSEPAMFYSSLIHTRSPVVSYFGMRTAR